MRETPATLTIELAGEAAQLAFGARLAGLLRSYRGLIYLRGDLGAGKTTLVRGLLRGLGYQAPVRSPTYTLIEPYEAVEPPVVHLDLYRLADPEELEYLGLRDLLERPGLILVEWPERGAGALPPADLELLIEDAGKPAGRDAEWDAELDAGRDSGPAVGQQAGQETSP
ncbi:MAG: tRNA (adenosine(37)-N6)-threonylcarbamoyltransferase complex ATPase subunit type 1 TsaE, partial [Halochromatium sp.]|uniref:tRNA (adenosine(37)-N6)-threonylcarbamoyltransferase complex ATPase subunit type 1 TsaE n=2 Tax=Halochromatium sp. TaxID=2049430 RepID=UPI00397DED68